MRVRLSRRRLSCIRWLNLVLSPPITGDLLPHGVSSVVVRWAFCPGMSASWTFRYPLVCSRPRYVSTFPSPLLLAVGALLVSMASYQCGAAMAKQLFPTVGAQGATAFRLGLGCIDLVAGAATMAHRAAWCRLTRVVGLRAVNGRDEPSVQLGTAHDLAGHCGGARSLGRRNQSAEFTDIGGPVVPVSEAPPGLLMVARFQVEESGSGEKGSPNA